MFEQFCDRQDLDFMQMDRGSGESIAINIYGVCKLSQVTLKGADSRQESDN